jgi:uncharacterized protein YjbI with pentapeptide repeats
MTPDELQHVLRQSRESGLRPDLRGAKLSGADLSEADLRGAKLSWADLSEADLSDANLSGAKLSGAVLSEADLRGAVLSWADLSDANLSGADLRETNLSDADLRGAVLSGANLRKTNLSWANLSWANLSWANLSGADLCETNLSGADLCGADLRETNLSGADLCGALGLNIVEDAPARLLAVAHAALASPHSLEMSDWHTCKTKHCISGWAEHLGGPLAKLIIEQFGNDVGGLMLLGVEAHAHFYKENDDARVFLQSVIDQANASQEAS